MKTSIILIMLPALLAFLTVGCGDRKTATTRDGAKLSMLAPANQTMKQGETNKVAITITRDGFEGEVDIDFKDLPKGVTVAEETVIPASDNIRTFTLVAAPDAMVVENRIVTVEAKAKGASVPQTFELTVKPK